MVPLLVLWLGYGEREAAGTSLLAIVVIASAATLSHGAYGNVRVGRRRPRRRAGRRRRAAGTWLQQRVEPRTVRLLFAGLLTLSAIELLAGR